MQDPTGLPVVGDVLADRYRIDEQIGAGGMGAVFRATQLGLSRAVAVKVMLPSLMGDPSVRPRFEREARVMSTLRHPGAVQVFDFGVDRGRMYIVMELLLGESLHARLRRVGGLSLEHAARIVADVADVLAAAHEVPLIHRDLKPDNIFLEYDQAKERVKVVDFGLAFIVDEGDLGRLTREDLVSGTPLYLSPEQASAGDVHAPADIYSLGIMLYELIAGETPFSGAPAHLLAAHLYTPHPPLRTKRRDVPTKLERLVDAMLHKDPTRRPTAAQVAAELREFEPDMGRERSGSHRVARSARAIDDHSRAAKSAAANNTALLAVYGAMSEQLRTALATNGIVAMNVSEAVPATADVVLFLEPDLDLERIKAIGLPAVATASPDDLPRITALMRAGVREVVALPVDIDDVVRKVKRVWSKRPRASLGSAT